MTTYWFPASGHPEGMPGRDPWFRVEGSWGYRARGHPGGPSEEPCFHITRGRVNPTFSLPGPADAEVSFVIIGSFVYQAGGAGPPWFRVQPDGSASVPDATDREPAEPTPGPGGARGPADARQDPTALRPGPPAHPTKGAAMRGMAPPHDRSSGRRHPPFQRSYREVNPPVDGCPVCGSSSICWVPGREGQTNYLCEACGRCWNSTSNGTVRVSPIDCPGCAHREACFEQLRSEIAAFAWRPA